MHNVECCQIVFTAKRCAEARRVVGLSVVCTAVYLFLSICFEYETRCMLGSVHAVLEVQYHIYMRQQRAFTLLGLDAWFESHPVRSIQVDALDARADLQRIFPCTACVLPLLK